MKVQIENVTATEQRENFEMIEKCVNAISETTTIEDAFEKIKKVWYPLSFWKYGRGANHIWVSNWKNERLLLITE